MFPPVSGEMFLWRAKTDASDNKNRAHRYNPFLILDHFNDSTLLFIYTLFFYVYLICKYMPAFFVFVCFETARPSLFPMFVCAETMMCSTFLRETHLKVSVMTCSPGVRGVLLGCF